LEVKLAVPGSPGTGTNPEQLFAVVGQPVSCRRSRSWLPEQRSGYRLISPLTRSGPGTTGPAYFLQARLNVSLPGLEREVAQALVDGAHQECPYSKATHGNINVVTNLVLAPANTDVARNVA